MSAKSISEWFSLLNALVVRDQELDELAPDRYAQDRNPEKAPLTRHHRWLVSRLSGLFRDYHCSWYLRWLVHPAGSPSRPSPEEKPPPEEETAALHAVIDWLKPAPDQVPYLTPEESHGLLDLRRRVVQAAQARLNTLAEVKAEPWEGDDWDELEPQVRQLLLYMNGRKEADLGELCPVVWGKDYADVSAPARETTMSKANKFLRKRASLLLLSKPRGESRLFWK